MENLWIIYGKSMGNGHLWKIYGKAMENLTLYGKSLDSLWIVCGNLWEMEIYGKSKDNLWRIYG